MTPGSVVVVGGGVIGTACAHYLHAAGARVTVLDQGRIGGACSHGNCGFVCPSHVLPLAEPGMVGKGLRALFAKNSAFSIRPRFDPALWSWLFRFARRCNEATMLSDARAIQALANSARTLYDDLMKREALECEWQTRGLLFVYQTAAEMNHYAALDRLLAEHFQQPAVRYDGEAVRELEPALKPGLAGGWHYPGDAHLRPDRLMASWRKLLEARGVTFRENGTLQGFNTSPGRATEVMTTQGPIAADAFVIATGAWTPLLNEQLGCRIPIQPGKGYSLTMPRPKVCPAVPLIFPEHKVAVTPMQSGYRIGSTMEFAGYDTTINPARLQLLRDGASHYLQEPSAEPVEETWYGWRPMTYDSKPVIDRCPTMRNVLIAAGHNMLGLTMAPATGKLVTELLTETTPHINPAPYALRRFGG